MRNNTVLQEEVRDMGALENMQPTTELSANCSEFPNSSDTISRQAALDCLEWQYPDKLPRTKIMELPPVTPKQRTGKWIPVERALPDEEDSIFARYYGTDRWSKSMFRKKSREVIVTSVFENGELHTEVAHTTDGEWHVGINVVPRKVIAWMPLPEPYQPNVK